MTQLLQKAFTEITRLPETEQDQIARMLLAELASECRWQKAFAKSPNSITATLNKLYETESSQLKQPLVEMQTTSISNRHPF